MSTTFAQYVYGCVKPAVLNSVMLFKLYRLKLHDEATVLLLNICLVNENVPNAYRYKLLL